MDPLVSILIPAYNATLWLRDSVESALSQSWRRKELIIVDDGSSDGTTELARSMQSSSVLVAVQPNRGAAAARNHALSLSQGDYLQWLDCDDVLFPDKIEQQMRVARECGTGRVLLSGSWGRFFREPSRARYRPTVLWQDLSPTEWLYCKIRFNLWTAIQAWLVSRELTQLTGPWDETLSRDDDGEYFARVISRSNAVKFVAESHSACRRGNIGLSHDSTMDGPKMESQARSVLLQIRALLSLEDSRRTREASLRFLSESSIDFIPERPDLVLLFSREAERLGGRLEEPMLRSPYQFLRPLLGWRAAKSAQAIASELHLRIERHFERIVYPRTSPTSTSRGVAKAHV